jgi:hypothetical protein
MEARTIRVWHYTRLTDPEVKALRTGGIDLSTLETTRQRLDAQVAGGQISVEIGNALFAANPFHASDQSEPRSNKFRMTSHPVRVDNDTVILLVANRGGEAVYFWLQVGRLQQIVAGIGRARVVEVGVPLDATRQAYSADKAVVATFARSLGCIPDSAAFDLCAIRPLGTEAVVAIHTDGEAAFERIGSGYPISFQLSEQ